MLTISNITYRLGDRVLFDRASLSIPAGRKVGLVGRNGAGKSTLIRLLFGEIPLESGDIQINPNASIGHVSQEVPGDDRSLKQVVLDAHREMSSLTKEADTATDPDRIAEIHTRLADIGAHTAEARASTILKGLGFDEAAQVRPARSFSGGWRMRVALAATLFVEPDLLLLDEPTNYLDLEGVLWLETYIARYPYTVLLISHDRDLLNKAVTHIAHLSECKLTLYSGGYDDFERLRAEHITKAMAMKAKQEKQRRHMEAFVTRFKAKASKARQAQSRIKMLEKMKPIATLLTEETIPFQFPKPSPLSSPLFALEDAATGYGGPDILSNLSLRIDMDDRIALLGANGNGKSTFAKLLAGRLAATSGHVRRPKKLKIGYFAQHQLDELDGKQTPYEALKARVGIDMIEAKIRARLGSFGFGADKADREILSLSGGEKARLLFSLATLDAPQLLILDEPTNHLDVDSRQALVQALNEYDGAVLLISHDRHLVEATIDRLWLVQKGSVAPFDGDLSDYKRIILETEKKPKQDQATSRSKTASKEKQRQSAADARRFLKPLKDRISRLEDRLSKTEKALLALENALGDPAIYAPENKAKLLQISDKTQTLKAQKSDLEMGWLEAQDDLENALKNTQENAPDDAFNSQASDSQASGGTP